VTNGGFSGGKEQGVAMMEQINDEIFVGPPATRAELIHRKIKYVIDVSGISRHGHGYKCDCVYPIADGGRSNDPEQFLKIMYAIDKALKAGKKPILIQCHGGVSRSPAIAALYMYHASKFKTFDDAIGYVRTRSKAFVPNLELIDFIKREVCSEIDRDNKS
jgi:hypothetical protein